MNILRVLCLLLLPIPETVACPLCATSIGQQVRAGIFNQFFFTNLFYTLLPFIILILIVLFVSYGSTFTFSSKLKTKPNKGAVSV